MNIHLDYSKAMDFWCTLHSHDPSFRL